MSVRNPSYEPRDSHTAACIGCSSVEETYGEAIIEHLGYCEGLGSLEGVCDNLVFCTARTRRVLSTAKLILEDRWREVEACCHRRVTVSYSAPRDQEQLSL